MPERQTRILVVDDDQRLRDLLKRYLSDQGLQVSTVADASAMDRQLPREPYDLLILDLMLPGEDGLQICKRLRHEGIAIPILMLTARGDDIDRIIGLELGADDYLPKPFNPRELLARIHAILRRIPEPLPGSAPATTDTSVQFGPYRLNLGSRTLYRDHDALPLTSGQFALLKALVTQPRKPISRSHLMQFLNERDYDGTERGIDIQISRLRRLLEVDPKQPRYIQTVWGKGYVFVPDGVT